MFISIQQTAIFAKRGEGHVSQKRIKHGIRKLSKSWIVHGLMNFTIPHSFKDKAALIHSFTRIAGPELLKPI